MKQFRWPAVLLVLVSVCALSSCEVAPKKVISGSSNDRSIAVFFDGTSNDEVSDTNVKKLHSLMTLQRRDDIASIYIEGVGAKGKILGMMTGWGTGVRVRAAYSFLLKNYRPGDRIYIFGFSRGAYSARILASFLHYAGLPIANGGDADTDEATARLYKAFKGEMSGLERRQRINEAKKALNMEDSGSIEVEVMGLWDTVEALGVPNYKVDILAPNVKYGDQLCNVKHAYHALSIDDNRERIFTPIILNNQQLLTECDSPTGAELSIDEGRVVDEVWFSGSHSDVGGGYGGVDLSGVSLNWMIAKLATHKILPNGAAVPENRYADSHDPEAGFPWKYLYRRQPRNLKLYSEFYSEVGISSRLKVHQSVVMRLERLRPKPNEYDWMDAEAFPECFELIGGGYKYLPQSGCFTLIE